MADIARALPVAGDKAKRPVMTFAAQWARATVSILTAKQKTATATKYRLAELSKALPTSSPGEARQKITAAHPATRLAELTPATAPASADIGVVPLPPRRAPEAVQSTPLPRPRPASASSAQAQPKIAHVEADKAAPKVAAIAPKQQIAKAAPEPELHTGSIPPQAKIETNSPLANNGHTAIYDIEAHTVYLPDGRRLEAHSGLGRGYDNPRYVEVRMHGPTPPNLYDLTLRRQLFHGVRAIRLNPVDESKMHGRAGMLAHTYMLGSRGASFGCVSFKDYPAFLHAYLKGKIDRLRVVAHLDSRPTPMARAHPRYLTRWAYNY
jgi:hypothetical protein